MKKATLKGISLALATVLSMSSMMVNVSAYVPYEGDGYEFEAVVRETESRADTVYVSREDLANGAYHFDAGIYIVTEKETPEDIGVCWDSFYEDGDPCGYISFPHVNGIGNGKSDTEVISEYAVEGVDDVEKISQVLMLGRYDNGCLALKKRGHSGANYVLDNTICGVSGEVFAAGENRIYYEAYGTVWGYEGISGYYDVTVDKKTGIATTVEAVDENGRHLSIPRYNPNTPEGQKLTNTLDYLSIIGTTENATSWYDGKSDARPFANLDVQIEPEISDGVYYIGFKREPNMRHGTCTQEYDDRDYWLKIVVGDGEADETVSYDINNDGVVDMQDASAALSIYAQQAAGVALYQSSSNAQTTNYLSFGAEILDFCAKQAAGLA